MPHIIVEHSGPLSDKMLDALHQSVAAQDTIDIKAIKTRAIPVEDNVIGDGSYEHFVHITVKVLEGRSEALLKKIGADLKEVALKNINPETTALSIEIVEMNPATYVK